jgi:hypothetical protein
MMEILAAVVAVLSAGAAAAGKEAGGQLVKTAYEKLKGYIGDRTKRKAAVAALEEAPESASLQAAVVEALKAADAAHDAELARLSAELTQALTSLDASQAAAIGVDIGRLKAHNATFSGITASGTGVSIKELEAGGDVRFENINAGRAAPKN